MSEVRRSGPVLMQLRRAPTTGLDEEKPMETGHDRPVAESGSSSLPRVFAEHPGQKRVGPTVKLRVATTGAEAERCVFP
ncbi:unnamed protein product [Heligmosomoides polygyrus]|uniref:Uncharacterized protein n=1 Tax=Heligmosomoides polygyrus TaxID=6339 RepID=A0A183F6T8_HELPZ|nr:unnamed protein product [Heligmosomoides polygyrus]